MPRTKGLHPSFKKKPVVRLECTFCGHSLCDRAMKAILLADVNVELYSTDYPPENAVDFVNEAYRTEKCTCYIKDVACLSCGNVVGYTVVRPCNPCLASCNNGHLWMFNSTAVDAIDRIDHEGDDLLLWGRLLEDGDTRVPSDEECLR